MALNTELESGVHWAFGTPIMIRKMPDVGTINQALRSAVLKAEQGDNGVQANNVGGWQSAPTLLESPTPEIATLREWIEKATIHITGLLFQAPVTLEYSAYAWASVNRNGDFNRIHNHAEDDWTFVYYVACGKPEQGHRMNGKFELRDPRPAARYPGLAYAHGMIIDPEPSMFLAFPAWLDHQVHPFFGSGEHISIAANIKVQNIQKKPPK